MYDKTRMKKIGKKFLPLRRIYKNGMVEVDCFKMSCLNCILIGKDYKETKRESTCRIAQKKELKRLKEKGREA